MVSINKYTWELPVPVWGLLADKCHQNKVRDGAIVVAPVCWWCNSQIVRHSKAGRARVGLRCCCRRRRCCPRGRTMIAKAKGSLLKAAQHSITFLRIPMYTGWQGTAALKMKGDKNFGQEKERNNSNSSSSSGRARQPRWRMRRRLDPPLEKYHWKKAQTTEHEC